jgi:Ca2+-binding RTX toxin-like protein
MANVKFYQSYNMVNPTIFYGTVTTATSTQLILNDFAGTSGAYFGRDLTYSGSSVIGGTVTGYDGYRNYSIAATVRDVSVDARTLANLVNVGNAKGVEEFVLSGNDIIEGSNFADSLLGYGGNDFITGGGGNDFIDGGSGTDTAVYSQARANYVVSSIAGGYRVVGSEGTDTLNNIENIRFSDGTFSISTLIAPAAPTVPVQKPLRTAVDHLFDANGGYGIRYVATDIKVPGTIIAGTLGDDRIDGTSGVDYIAGYRGYDLIFAGDGNDVIYPSIEGGMGMGGNGIDTLIFGRTLSNSIIEPWVLKNDAGSPIGLGISVTNKLVPSISVKFLTVERLQFLDTSIALDIAPTENAGSVYMLYKAAFNRPSDVGGMGYWIAQKDSGKNIVTDIAQGFVNSAEFIVKYGTNPTNASYVNNLYQNVLGRSGEAGGVAYWTGEMDAGRVSKAQALVQFATLPEGAGLVAPLIANGIQYQEWLG